MREAERQRAWPAALAVTAGAFANVALTFNHNPRDGAVYAASFGLPVMAIVFAIAYGASRAAGALKERWTGRPLRTMTTLAVGVVAASLLALLGLRHSRPAAHFESLVTSPIPASVQDLKWRRFPTFSDGDMQALAFTIAPPDLPTITDALRVREVAVDWGAPATRAHGPSGDATGANEIVYAEDQLLHQLMPDLYRRPAQARFFTGDRVRLVTDATGQRVWILFDRRRTH